MYSVYSLEMLKGNTHHSCHFWKGSRANSSVSNTVHYILIQFLQSVYFFCSTKIKTALLRYTYFEIVLKMNAGTVYSTLCFEAVKHKCRMGFQKNRDHNSSSGTARYGNDLEEAALACVHSFLYEKQQP